LKNVYVILAFHAHEMLWDLPELMLSYLDDDNPMKEGITGENYLKKRKEEGRDIYSHCSNVGEILNAPMCVEYTNELLVQIKDVMPKVFEGLKKDYKRGRLYPLYGHAHHSHVSLLRQEEMTQDILWNRQYLHHVMEAPYPKYNGLFPTEASLSYAKMGGIEDANIDYVIFPHLAKEKTAFEVEGEGDYIFRPFWIKGPRRNILALPRNFSISQEIWRPITKMKRDEVKSQGYMLGDFAVFDSEYLTGQQERYPISLEVGVEMYKEILRRELKKAPEGGVLLYVQDLELMDFGDIALTIIERAWQDIRQQDGADYTIHFVTPDDYIDRVLKPYGMEKLPTVKFDEISWAPEIRLILRVDGHYPPLGIKGAGPYDIKSTGIYDHPHIFWENGKYYTGIFDSLLQMFGISVHVPVDVGRLGKHGYDLAKESPDSQAVLYLRLMKRACNWGWRPTEGRQKRPCLLGYLLCSVLLKKLEERPVDLVLNREPERIDQRNFVGLSEILKVFIDGRINYLKYGLDEYARENNADLSAAYALFDEAENWKHQAQKKVKDLYELNNQGLSDLSGFLRALQGYAQALYMATDYIQRVWSKAPDTDYLVEKMYHYLYRIYPPLFPAIIDSIDAMSPEDVKHYFEKAKVRV